MFQVSTKKIFALTAFLLINTGLYAQTELPVIPETIRAVIQDANNGTAIGYSFNSPVDEGWTMKKDGLSVSLDKKGVSADENSQIESYVMRLDSQINANQLKRNIEKGYSQNDRFKIISLSVVEEPKRPQCVITHLLLQDLKPVRTVDHQQPKFSEQYALSCGFLKNKGIGVEVRYYQRFYDANKDPKFMDRANQVFASLVLEDQ